MIRPARLAVAAATALAAAVVVSSCSFGPDPSGTLIGHVYKEGTLQPIPGAIVECQGLTATADATGSYSIEGIVPGVCAVSASAQGYEDYSSVVEVRHVTTDDIYLSVFVPKAHLFGTVSHAIEGPIRGATVDLGGAIVVSDSSGFYEYMSIPQGTYHVTVTKPGYRTYSTSLFHVDSAECQRDIGLKKLATADFAAQVDATRSEQQPSTNFGAAPTLELLHNDFYHRKFLIRIPVALPPSAEVVSAALRLANVGPGGEGQLSILTARVLASWDEMRITWADSLDTTGGSAASATYEAPWCEIDVTPHVAYWIGSGHMNYGLEVDASHEPDGASFSFASTEYADVALRPFLTVNYAW
jgi:hypothetical protein